MNLKSVVLAALATCAAATQAAPVYSGTVPANLANRGNVIGAGNQNYTQMLGLNFSILGGQFQLTHLGVFDHLRNGLTTAITVGLYELVGSTRSTIATTVFAAGTANTTGDQFIYKAVTGTATPIILDAGNYTIRAIGFNTANLNFNTNVAQPNLNLGNTNNDNTTVPIAFNTFGGLLQNRGSVYGGTLNAVGTPYAFSSTFGAGTLQLTQVVSEPAGLALLLAGVAGLAVTARRKKG